MEGPEQLQLGPAGTRRPRRWLVIGAAVLVVAGLGVVRASDHGSVPGPGPSRGPVAPSSTSASDEPWPLDAGLPAGTLYALTSGGVSTVDVTSGRVQAVVKTDAADARLTPMAGGVLVWRRNGTPQPQLLVPGRAGSRDLRAAMAGANTFLPGPQGRVWTAYLDPVEPAARSAWRLLDEQGGLRADAVVEGVAEADGSGGLFGVDRQAVEHVYPRPAERRAGVELLATGQDGYELVRCREGRCAAQLHERATGAVSDAGPSPAGPEPCSLSPGNRYLACVGQGPDSSDEVRVALGGSAAVVRAFPSGSYGTTFTWLSDRWLVSTSDLGLVLYDAVDDALLRPVLPLDEVAQLVWQPA